MNKDRVIIFDTTGRDGEQAGHSMADFAKMVWAKKAAAMGVDVVEAGFPVSSPGEAAAVAAIAEQVRGITVCALARANEKDILAAWESICLADRPRIHTFAPTSDIHIAKKLGKDRAAVLQMAIDAVRLAKSLCQDVEFSAEDATRTDMDYLATVVRAVIAAGATTVNIPDTVGYAQPYQYFTMLKNLRQQVPELADVVLSVHCHGDLGLAVANSLAGVQAGARQVEGCWLGIGERAGNAALEQVIMNLRTRQDLYQVGDGIDATQIGPMCRKLSRLIAYPIPSHQPVVGEMAFAHSSGIHRHGVLKDKLTYEIMSPEGVGWEGISIQLVSHLGRHGLSDYLTGLGYDGEALVDAVLPRYLALANAKGVLTNEDLHMIVQELKIRQEIDRASLFDLVDETDDDIVYGKNTGAVAIRRNGKAISRWAKGDGSIDALHRAIREGIIEHGVDLSDLELKEFHVEKGRGSSEAIGWVCIQVKQGNRTGYGRSGNPNVVVAAAKAYVYAINHMLNCPVSEVVDETMP